MGSERAGGATDTRATVGFSGRERRPWRDAALAIDVRRMALVFLILAVVLYRVSETVVDPDLWGHLKFGQDLLASGTTAQSDPYSYLTGDQPGIDAPANASG